MVQFNKAALAAFCASSFISTAAFSKCMDAKGHHVPKATTKAACESTKGHKWVDDTATPTKGDTTHNTTTPPTTGAKTEMDKHTDAEGEDYDE